MKKAGSLLLIIVFTFMNAFSFIGCRQTEAAEEVRACWVCSVGNLDFPSRQGLGSLDLMKEIDQIVINCKNTGINTIFFQVRPNGDALYRSEVFPWSVYLSGKQGVAPEGNFDPLAYFIEKAHAAGIALHAWINPYRIGSGSDVWSGLSADNPAVVHPEYTITSDSGVYYNPGLPEARQLILNGISELVRNYEIDGIHFDDYFYPYNLSGFDDSAAFSQYGGGLSLEDFRRNAVNTLVESTYKLIKTLNKNVAFGISPFGIWANQSVNSAGSATSGMSSYTAIFSDSKTWVERGWLDYICPQIYWSFENKAAPYDVLVDWWDRLCSANNMKLYIGIALYKVGTEEAGWESGEIMERQIAYAAAKSSYAGHCFFRYAMMMDNPLGARDSIVSYYGSASKKPVLSAGAKPLAGADAAMGNAETTQTSVRVPAATSLSVTSPKNGTAVRAAGISVAGTASPGTDVTVNGISAVTSEKGLFAAYVPLEPGVNQIRVQAGTAVQTLRVTRNDAERYITGFAEESCYPTGDVHRGAGEIIRFLAEAPSGSTVMLSNGTLSIPLYASDDETHYQAEWTVPALPVGDKLSLEGFYLSGGREGETFTLPLDLTLNLYAAGYSETFYLQESTYLFDESSGGSQMDHDPLQQGTPVTVVALEGERALLENGYWLNRSALGEEQAQAAEPAGYSYEIITVSSDRSFGYAGRCSEEFLEVALSGGRARRYEIETGSADLAAELVQGAQNGRLMIRSASGRRLAGYEIIAQENRITVYARFQSAGLAGKTIVLDAGHGGEDSGALCAGGAAWPTESQLNLVLAGYLKAELENAGVQVLMLREGDETVTLAQRVEAAVAQAPDLFISLHHNATDQTSDFTKATGGLMLYSSPLSENLAHSLADVLWEGIGDAGQVPARRQSLYVCRQTRYPAVLVEAGYLCNPVEYEMLCREDIARKIAKNIVRGLENYLVTDCS